MTFDFRINTATSAELTSHLTKCSDDFIPSLSSRIDIPEYARKISKHAVRFEAWDHELVGLVAAYHDVDAHSAFITNVSVLMSHRSRGIASHLLNASSDHFASTGVRRITLEVDTGNSKAVSLYLAHGFTVAGEAGQTMTLVQIMGARK